MARLQHKSLLLSKTNTTLLPGCRWLQPPNKVYFGARVQIRVCLGLVTQLETEPRSSIKSRTPQNSRASFHLSKSYTPQTESDHSTHYKLGDNWRATKVSTGWDGQAVRTHSPPRALRPARLHFLPSYTHSWARPWYKNRFKNSPPSLHPQLKSENPLKGFNYKKKYPSDNFWTASDSCSFRQISDGTKMAQEELLYLLDTNSLLLQLAGLP